MIIGGGIGLIIAIMGLVGGAALAAFGGGLIIVASIISLIGAALELVTGIVGVVNCKKPQKAVACIVWGFICFAVIFIGDILSFVSYASAGTGMTVTNIVSIILGLAIPVLYLIGAFLNRKTYNELLSAE